ncbi:MAG TPA: alpha/beta hydrolase-fold protein [Longimicrobiales bacterium]|nr:alpha/beta hydrolase-fold protein [Longimicrobiales bacterium]
MPLFPCVHRGSVLGVSMILAVLGTFPSAVPAPAQEPAEVLWHEAPALFPIRVHLPPEYDSTRIYPAIVVMHGFGESSRGMERIGRAFAEAGLIAVLPDAPYPVPYVFPDSGRHGSWELSTWTRELDLGPPLSGDLATESRSRDLTVFHFVPDLLDRVHARYAIGPVYSFGFSLGGVYALGGAFYHRERFDGTVVFGVGGMVEEWFELRGESMESGADLPIRFVVGDADRFVPIAEAERERDLLESAGYDVVFDLFEGGHTVPDDALTRAVEWVRGLADAALGGA